MSKAAELAALIGSQTALSNRNLIINGAMQVAQRGTSTTSLGYLVDRFQTQGSNLDELVVTASQSTTAPSGFSNSLKINIDTAESAIASDELFRVRQKIEAQNLQHLQYGSSGANSITLSFWVRANVTGTYAVSLFNQDGYRVTGSTYAINSADTWEYKEITFSGDTSGTINNDNGIGLEINWFLSVGSNFTGTANTSWAGYSDARLANGHAVELTDTANNNWHITGVQLEVGEQATPFEHRSYGDELARCQRYYTVINDNLTGDSNDYPCYPTARWSTSQMLMTVPLPTSLRASATVSVSGANIQFQQAGSSTDVSSVTHINTGRTQVTAYGALGFNPTSQTSGVAVFLTGARLKLDAEL